MDTATFNLWALIEPSEEVEGEWLAHCLNLDVMSQGSSPEEAIDMIIEASEMVIEDRLNRGADPGAVFVDGADREEWGRLQEFLQGGRVTSSAEVAQATRCFAVNYNIAFRRRSLDFEVPLGTLPAGKVRTPTQEELETSVQLHIVGTGGNDGARC